MKNIIHKLCRGGPLTREEFILLIQNRNMPLLSSQANIGTGFEKRSEEQTVFSYIKEKAFQKRTELFSNTVFLRGLIECTSYCKNNCLYCGIRYGNRDAKRYRLTKEEIITCCGQGYALGYRTFVLQGGEDPSYTDIFVADLVTSIKEKYSDCAVTLSFGEKPKQTYELWKSCGADRYLLRHETASKEHYEKLHPHSMSFENRMNCLHTLKDLGYQTGAGFMIGSPYQTDETLAEDLLFLQSFRPQMTGIGPFIPHRDTPFSHCSAGDKELTLYLLSLIRLILPHVLLPATTALGTIDSNGRELGLLHGANVIMPNLSPSGVRSKYNLYDNKVSTGKEGAESTRLLCSSIKNAGFEAVITRGDYTEEKIIKEETLCIM
jgi:biotin synthase